MSEFEDERASWNTDMDEPMYKVALEVARHELGHWFAAKACDFNPEDVQIGIDNIKDTAHRGGAMVSKNVGLYDVTAIRNYLRGRIITLNAGVLAEALEGNYVNNDVALRLVYTSGSIDDIKAKAYLTLLRNIEQPDTNGVDEAQKELNQLCEDLWQQATVIVQQASNAINGLAEILARKVQALGCDYSLSLKEIEENTGTIAWCEERKASQKKLE